MVQEGIDGPIPWTPCSLDITNLLDFSSFFFLWGCIRVIVYRTEIRDNIDLKQWITDAIATIDEAGYNYMLQRTSQEIHCRLDEFRVQ